jgi:sodium pump decarboxylase gamma subunit
MDSLFGQVAILCVLGMAVVFGFLALLIGALKVSSTLILKFAPAEAEQAPAHESSRPKGRDDEVVAAISGALKHHSS